MADDRYEHDPDDEEVPRSIFSAMWFRALVVVLVLGVIAAIAVPYALDLVSPPAPIPVATEPPKPAPPTPPPPVTPAPPTVATPAPPPSPAPAVVPATPAPSPPKPAPAPPPPQVAKAPAEPPPPPRPAPTTTARTTRTSPPRSAPGSWWVQVGAFKDPAAAKRLATILREQRYNVEESVHRVKREAPAPAPAAAQSDKYDVFVTGAAPAELAAKITAKGLAAETAPDGVVVKPSLPLREAVQLSKDLAGEGLKVHVRRAGGETAPAPTPAPIEEAFYRVRVGSYPDRATALAAVRDLEARGYKPFLVRESP